MMNIHHLNCGTLRPYYPLLMGVLYCLLVESDDGLVLVDTGFGLDDYCQPTPLMRMFTSLMRVRRDPGETAIRQVERLGFSTQDVRHIVLTHLHLDHAGGLPDFPHARVHLYRPEYEAAMHPRGILERFYIPGHWAHGPDWVLHEVKGDQWFDFECTPILPGLKPEILLVPLVGHTRGHSGVAIRTPAGWLLHCGDAASPFHRAVNLRSRPGVSQPLNFVPDRTARRLMGPHVHSLRALLEDQGDWIKMISSHDYHSFHENAQKRAPDIL